MPHAVDSVNEIVSEIFVTRGGRRGAGLGLLLEGLWGARMSSIMETSGLEIGWLADNHYNDYACVQRNVDWNPDTKEGELFRIEAKTMDQDADESKGHFDEPQTKIGDYEQLLVLFWKWTSDGKRSWPWVIDSFIGSACGVASIRDALHLARGGSFVELGECPDGCVDQPCSHTGEPLNAKGVRERSSGPVSSKGANVSFAANFGGLVRMLKTANADARAVFNQARLEDDVAHEYVSFIHRNFPNEEWNAYSTADWRRLFTSVTGKQPGALSIPQMQEAVAAENPDYRELLRVVDKL